MLVLVLAGAVLAASALGIDLLSASGSGPRSGRVEVDGGRIEPPGLYVGGETLSGADARSGRWKGDQELAAAASAPLVGSDGPVAVPSRDGRFLAYNTWRWVRSIDWHRSLADEGFARGDPLGTPTLRIREPSTREDRALEPGTFSAGWRADGALAYVRGEQPAYLANTPYLRQVVVRESSDAEPAVWSTEAERYLVFGWSGDRLLVSRQAPAGSPDVLVFDAPGKSRTLATTAAPVALSPDGTQLVVAESPADTLTPAIRVLDVESGEETARLQLEEALDPVDDQPLVALSGPGSWVGDHLVVSTNGGLAVFTVSSSDIQLEQVLHVDAAAKPDGGLYEPRFVDDSAHTIVTWADVPAAEGQESRSVQLVCDRFTLACTREQPVPSERAVRPIYDQSRGEG